MEGSHKEPKKEKNRAIFQLAKMMPTCKILKTKFRKFTIQVAKNFVAAKHLLSTCVPFRIFKSQFHSCEPTCEILKAKISQVHYSTCENFHSCETLRRHTCAILQLKNPISQLRTKLRNHFQLAKMPIVV